MLSGGHSRACRAGANSAVWPTELSAGCLHTLKASHAMAPVHAPSATSSPQHSWDCPSLAWLHRRQATAQTPGWWPGGWGIRTVAAGTLGRHMKLHFSCVWRRFNSTTRSLANHPPPPAPVDATFRCHGPDHLLIRQLVALDSRQHNKVAVVCAGIGLQQSGIVIGQVVIPALA